MKLIDWERLKGLRRMLVTDRPEPTRQAERIVAMQRDVVLPSKAGVILVVFYYLFLSDWLYEMPTTRSVVQDTLKDYFLVYILCNCLRRACFLLLAAAAAGPVSMAGVHNGVVGWVVYRGADDCHGRF